MIESTVDVLGQAEAHDHAPTLVEVCYDDLGRAVSEFRCTTCASVWFA